MYYKPSDGRSIPLMSLPLLHHAASSLPSFVRENLGTHQTPRAICGRQRVGTHRIFVRSGLEEQEVAGPAELTPAATGETQMPSAEGHTHPQGQVRARPMIGDMAQKVSVESEGIYRPC